MELWQQMVRDSVHTVDQLVEKFGIDRKVAEELDEFFQARINPYYLSLIRHPGDPIWRQCVPDKAELEDFDAAEDPLMDIYVGGLFSDAGGNANADCIAASVQEKEKWAIMKRYR